jgi:hypothetical protein
MVISHHSQYEIIHSKENNKKVCLSKSLCVGDVFSLHLYVHQHFWDSGRNETDVNKGQVEKKSTWMCGVGYQYMWLA